MDAVGITAFADEERNNLYQWNRMSAGSYGYRHGRSAHDTLAMARKRCWRQGWVLDLDVRAFFDSRRQEDRGRSQRRTPAIMPWVDQVDAVL